MAHPPQDEVRELDQKIQRLTGDLTSGDPDLRAQALLRMEAVGVRLEELLAKTSPGDRDLHVALYRCMSALGKWSEEQGLERRIEWMLQARDHAERAGFLEAIAASALEHSELLMAGGRLVESREVLLGGLADAPQSRYARSYVLYALAEVERELGLFDDALDHLGECERSLQGGEFWKRLSWRVPGTRGQLYLDLGLPDLAVEDLETEALATAELGLDRAKDIIASHVHQANLAVAQERFGRVESIVEQALANEELYASFPQWRATLELHWALALDRIEAIEGSLSLQPRKLLERALEEDLREADRSMALRVLGQNALRRGELELAAQRLAEARRVFDGWDGAVNNVTPRISLAAAEARLALAAAGSAGIKEERLAAVRSELEQAWRERLDLWSRFAPLRPGGAPFMQYGQTRGWLATLTSVLMLCEPERGAELALEQMVAVSAVGTRMRATASGPVRLAEVRAELVGKDHCTLVYLPSPQGTHLFAVDREGVHHFELAAGPRLNRLRREHRIEWNACLSAPTEEDSLLREEESAEQLARELIPPALHARLSRCSTVSIVGDLLGPVPFELLPFGASRLGWVMAVDHWPTLSYGLTLARRARNAPTDGPELFLLGVPQTADEVRRRWPQAGRIAVDREQLQVMTAALDSSRIERVLGLDATVESLQSPRLSSARIAQFFVHGVHDDRRERPATLVLSAGAGDPGLLSCEDVEGLRLPELVILSSCETVRGPSRKGEEAIGHLGGACLAAGARAVVGSQTGLSIDRGLATARLFYEELVAGASIAEALRRARVRLIEEGLVEHALDGGLMQVLGLGRETLFE